METDIKNEEQQMFCKWDRIHIEIMRRKWLSISIYSVILNLIDERMRKMKGLFFLFCTKI